MDSSVVTRPGMSLHLEKALFEKQLAVAIQRRLLDENRRLEYRLAERDMERVALSCRVEQSERFLSDVRTSRAWRVVQALRGVVGRRW